MSVSQNLMMALLSLDSYNQGYNKGVNFTGGLVNATFIDQSKILNTSAEFGAGFHAIAYSWNGFKVISYRGTDSIFGV